MKKFLLTLCLVVTAFGALVQDAEAKRLGGGKSVGMQRESISRPAPSSPTSAPARNATAPAQAPAPTPAPAAPAGNRWLGPLAGLAAGVGLGALLGSGAMGGMGGALGSMLTTILMIAALAFVVSFALRLFRRQSAEQAAAQYAGASASMPYQEPLATSTYTPTAVPVSTSTGHIPADFDVDGFVRVAKVNFLRLQAANDEGNIDDLREFLSPELLAEVRMEIEERGKVVQRTDVQQLNADLLDVVSEGNRHVASVRFHGMIKEEESAPAAPFNEVWHLSKPLDGSRGWTIAGIQQLS